MGVSAALTATELSRVKSASAVRRYLVTAPDTQIATARINQSQFGYPLAQLTVDNTSGWSDVRPGMTVLIGSSSGGHEYGIYRVRRTPGANILYVGEMGSGDAGRLPTDLITGANIADDAYITVLDRYDLWSVFPRIDFGSGAIYEDYERSLNNWTTTPPPIVNVTINGKGGHYAKKVADGATHALTCAATLTHWTSSSATYQWEYPAAWTGVSGATTATLSATAPVGNYTVRCTITPNVGSSVTVVRHVWICDTSSNPPLAILPPQSDVRDRTGRRMLFTLPDDSWADIPDGAMVHYWEEPVFADGEVSSLSDAFTGWVIRARMKTGEGLRDTDIEVVGSAGILNYLHNVSHYIEAVASPSKWTEVIASLSSASFLAFYLLSQRAGNALALFNFTPHSTSASGQRLPAWSVDKGTLLQQLQQLATARGNFGANSRGEFYFLLHPAIAAYSGRSSYTNRDTLTAALYGSIEIEQRLTRATSQVRGEALSWDGTVGTAAVPYLSDAPSVPAQGGAPARLGSMVVADQGTLNQITGDYEASLNNPYPGIEVNIPYNRDVYEPAEMYFVQVQVAAAYSPTGVLWDKRCIPVSVSKQHQDDGSVTVSLSLEVETSGFGGISVPVPPPNTNIYTPPFGTLPLELPPITLPPLANWGDDFDYDPDDDQDQPVGGAQYGRFIGATSDGRVWRWTGDGSGGAFEDISPTAGQRTTMGALYRIHLDPYRLKRCVIWGAGGIAYTEDVLAVTPVWSIKTFTSGTGFDFQPALNLRDTWYCLYHSGGKLYLSRTGNFFTTISTTEIADYVAGDVTPSFTVNPHNWREVWVAAGTEAVTTYDFTASDNGWTVVSNAGFSPADLGVYSAGVGYIQTQNAGVAFPNNRWAYCQITKSFTAQTVTRVRVWYTRAAGNSLADDVDPLARLNISDNNGLLSYTYGLNGAGVAEWTGSSSASSLTIDFEAGFRNDSVDCTATVVIDKIEVSTTNQAGLYRSVDGGTSFTQSIMLDERGGLPWWNWSTQTANTRNTTTANFRHVQGIDGSDNIKMVAGLTGTPVTIVSADATQYPETGLAFGFLARDLDYGWYLARTGNTYKTTNGGTSWSAATAITGGASFVVWGGFQYPADSSFWGYYGYRCLGYTLDAGANWISLWTDYETFRAATYGSDNETIVGVICNIHPHYPVPPTGGT